MNEQNNALPREGQILCVLKPEVTRRDRLFLSLSFCYCFLLADALHWPWGLGNTVTVFLWLLLLTAFLGPETMFRRPESRVLLVVNLALAASFALTSNFFFRWWNFLALLVLLPLHSLSVCGVLPWWNPAMLWERFLLLMWGLFGNLWASFERPKASEQKVDPKRTLAVIMGACGGLALVSILLPVLLSADALFAAVAENLRFAATWHFGDAFWRLLTACVLTPFLFGFLFSLRHPRPLKYSGTAARTDSLIFALMLAALDVLYLLFLGVQSAGLFGGPEYLAGLGISYAEWARSGFFQMVGVTVVNLTLMLAALSFSRQEGRGWSGVRVLSAALSLESLILLASAAWRMSLYVAAYGLSFKRCMTYWGMSMMALFFLAALLKIRKPAFSFCRIAFPLALAGWLAINCVPIDWLTARNQVDRWLDGSSPSVSASYLLYDLSYQTIPQLERLDGSILVRVYDYGSEIPLSEMLQRRRDDALQDCRDWRSWTLSAFLVS